MGAPKSGNDKERAIVLPGESLGEFGEPLGDFGQCVGEPPGLGQSVVPRSLVGLIYSSVWIVVNPCARGGDVVARAVASAMSSENISGECVCTPSSAGMCFGDDLLRSDLLRFEVDLQRSPLHARILRRLRRATIGPPAKAASLLARVTGMRVVAA